MKRLSSATVLFTFLIDNLAWALAFPIFAPFFLDPSHFGDLTAATRTTLLGLFLGLFSIGQFLGAPLIGDYADRKGRRRAFLVSNFFTFVGMGLTSFGIQVESLPMLFFGRLVTGLFAGNMSLCFVALADISADEAEKLKRYGSLSLMAGLSFVFGAFVGGKLSDPEIYPAFNAHIPFWIATGMCGINFLAVGLFFKETFPIPIDRPFRFFASLENVRVAFSTESLRKIFTIFFLFLFSWTLLIQFTPVLFVRSFHFHSGEIGDLSLYIGVWWALGAMILERFLLPKLTTWKILEGGLLTFTLATSLIIFADEIQVVLLLVALSAMTSGAAWPVCNGVLSNLASREFQGRILGVSQSIQSLAMGLAPLLGGWLDRGSPKITFATAAVACLTAAALYYTVKKE
jgi:DHA1 family tetracycline resistance protein-like MFS transporter